MLMNLGPLICNDRTMTILENKLALGMKAVGRERIYFSHGFWRNCEDGIDIEQEG